MNALKDGRKKEGKQRAEDEARRPEGKAGETYENYEVGVERELDGKQRHISPNRRSSYNWKSRENNQQGNLLGKLLTKLEGKDVKIRYLQKTNDGNLLIQVKKGGANILKEEIKKKANVVAWTRKPRNAHKVIHIRDIDEVSTQEEVGKGSKTESAPSGVQSTEYRGTQNITLKIEKVACNRLGERIKICIKNCRIEERVEVELLPMLGSRSPLPQVYWGGEKELLPQLWTDWAPGKQ
ncbi:hypothetical protein JTB14_021291 [Gonioctena quinquepunctata]|nr:hypothetical protein JTB14_021291 [Gonioctena quinquepunctata]